jgi:thiamine biosynthesis protein ThiS
MRIKINGHDGEFPDGSNIIAVLAAHKLTPDKVAVELNRKLVRAAQYATALKDGDELEIVTFVGGG